MNNLLSIIKDIVISGVIAILTSGLFEVSNTIYQSIITVLILVIIFLILRGIEKMSKKLEILSILYVEQFLLPFLKSLDVSQGLTVRETRIEKVKVCIILPQNMDEIEQIRETLRTLDMIQIPLSQTSSRNLATYGKFIGRNQLILFDTPASWMASLNYLKEAKGMDERKISQLLVKMDADIQSYASKVTEDLGLPVNLNFIHLSDFENYYN